MRTTRHLARTLTKWLLWSWVLLLGLLLCLPLAFPARADEVGGLFSEIGGGVKLPTYSSFLESPACKKAMVIQPAWPENPRGLTDPYSCGGDNPVFVGWLIGWEFPNGVRVGLFHKSQWFDGNGELQFNCICASYTIRWRKFR